MSAVNVLLSADSIGKSFGPRVVLTSASFWAEPGRITVILGRNGCGKSTLLRIAAGGLSADHGAVHYAGRAYLRPQQHRLAAAGLFFLPEAGLLSARFSGADYLAALRERFPEADPAEVERHGVGKLLSRLPGQLSLGERRRVNVALACARRPRCLLADEPLAGIAPADAERLAAHLRALAARGCAVVVTGHEVPQLLAVADTVVWAVAGTTHWLGAPAEAVEHEQFRREYLGMGALHPSPLAH